MEIIKLRIKHPAIEKNRCKSSINSNLCWDISETDLLEMATSFHTAKIAFKNGKEATFIEIEQFLEAFFQKGQIKRPYNKKSKLPNRVSMTPFLDKLKECFISDYNSKL